MLDNPQSVDYTVIRAKFNDFLTQVGNLADAESTLSGIGSKPALPQYINDANDYNDVIESRNTWDNSFASLTEQIASYTSLKAQAGTDVIAVIPPNTWVWMNIVQPDDGDTSHHYWLGYNTNNALAGYVPVLRYQVGESGVEPTPPLTDGM